MPAKKKINTAKHRGSARDKAWEKRMNSRSQEEKDKMAGMSGQRSKKKAPTEAQLARGDKKLKSMTDATKKLGHKVAKNAKGVRATAADRKLASSLRYLLQPTPKTTKKKAKKKKKK